MDELLTTKQVQDLLQIDRTTVYRMLNDGRLTGVKVGNQWRFHHQEIEGLLGRSPAGYEMGVNTSDILPLHCVQAIQDVFAELAGVAAVTLDGHGAPLTEYSNLSPFLRQVFSTSMGERAYDQFWNQILSGSRDVNQDPAGLYWSACPINLDTQAKACLVAFGFLPGKAEEPETTVHLREFAFRWDTEEGKLSRIIDTVPRISEAQREHLIHSLRRVAETFEEIGRERSELLGRLKKIADMSTFDET